MPEMGLEHVGWHEAKERKARSKPSATLQHMHRSTMCVRKCKQHDKCSNGKLIVKIIVEEEHVYLKSHWRKKQRRYFRPPR